MTETRQPEPETILTPEVRAWIGKTSGALLLPEEISASDVRRFVEATGDSNRLWRDDAFARAHGYRGRVVPPIMVIEMNWRTRQPSGEDAGRLWHQLPLPPEYSETRNAGLEIEWLDPVYVGDCLSVEHRIADIVARLGRRGLGVYVTRESEFRNQVGAVVARVRQTVVKLPRARVEDVAERRQDH